MGDLFNKEALRKHLEGVIEWKNLLISGGYKSVAFKTEDIWNWLMKYSKELEEYICDTGVYLENALKEGKKVMFEAQLGALRDT